KARNGRRWGAFCASVVWLMAWRDTHSLAGQSAVASVVPDKDTFVRSVVPTGNYGGGGALSVSGAGATNDLGPQDGVLDALIAFPLTNIVASFNDAFGGQNWLVTKARLILNESAAPDNDIFNRGVGAFEVRCLASDPWIEGTGRPNAPTTDGVAWQDLPGILN